MLNDLTLKSAEEKDLSEIIQLFMEDEFGSMRECLLDSVLPSYREAF